MLHIKITAQTRDGIFLGKKIVPTILKDEREAVEDLRRSFPGCYIFTENAGWIGKDGTTQPPA